MPLSPELLDAVDARIDAERQAAASPALQQAAPEEPNPTPSAPAIPVPQQATPQEPTPYVVRGAASMKVSPSLTTSILDAVDARIRGRQQAAGQSLAAKMAPRQPLSYGLRGASPKESIANLVAQSQERAKGIKQPVWWMDNLATGSVVWTLEGLAHRIMGTTVDQRRSDPIFMEMYRKWAWSIYWSHIRAAQGLAESGKTDVAWWNYKQAERYLDYLELVP